MRRSVKKKWITIVGIFLVLIGSLGTYAFYQYQQLFNRMYSPLSDEKSPKIIGIGSATNSISPKTEATKIIIQPFTMLLIGVDTRGEKQSRSDSMFLAVVNPGRQTLTLVPIPRDIYVKVSGYGMEKMNHAMFYGGVTLLKQTIENFFDLQIQRYVTVDFEGFKRLVDEIGGVEVDVKKRMRYYDPADGTDINLYKGIQKLDGKKALDYARYRRSNIGRDDSDDERSARQIELIKAIMEQGKEKLSIFRIFSFFDIAGDHIKTDLTKKEIERLVPVYKGFSVDQLRNTTIEGDGKRLPYGKLHLFFYVVSDLEKERIKEYIREALLEISK